MLELCLNQKEHEGDSLLMDVASGKTDSELKLCGHFRLMKCLAEKQA